MLSRIIPSLVGVAFIVMVAISQYNHNKVMKILDTSLEYANKAKDYSDEALFYKNLYVESFDEQYKIEALRLRDSSIVYLRKSIVLLHSVK